MSPQANSLTTCSLKNLGSKHGSLCNLVRVVKSLSSWQNCLGENPPKLFQESRFELNFLGEHIVPINL